MSGAMHRKGYEALLRAYPVEFRESFPEMAEVFESRVSEARERGGFAVARVWVRELTGLPSSVAAASSPTGSTSVLNVIVLIAGLVAIGTCAGHELTTAGLFHRTTQAALLMALVASGYCFAIIAAGVRLRVTVLLVGCVAGMLAAPPVADRALLRLDRQGVSDASLPWMEIRVATTSSHARALADPTGPASKRTVDLTRVHGGILSHARLRTGGVDGIYAAVTVAVALMTLLAVRPRNLAVGIR